ncbi:MAG: hypothetical protein ACRDAX_01190 [Propionibacteriaceae bacterium]
MRVHVSSKEALDAMRSWRLAMTLVRLGVAVSGVALFAGLVLLLPMAFPFSMAIIGSFYLIGLLAAIKSPTSSGASTVLVAAIIWCFVTGRSDLMLWKLAVVCGLMLVFHHLCSWAASAPLHAVTSRKTIRIWLLGLLAVAVVSLALGAFTVAIGRLPLGNSVAWIGLFGLVVLAGVIYFTLISDDTPPGV